MHALLKVVCPSGGDLLAKKRFYAVAVGRKPGIYEQWEGSKGAAAQVENFPGAKFKGFAAREDAENWIQGSPSQAAKESASDTNTRLYCDGSCIINPGPGGYGVILKNGHHRKEFSAGFRLTTNNRMELLACIAGLKSLRGNQTVEIYSDSSYLINGLSKGWAARWQANDWMRNKQEKAGNADLWEELLKLSKKHTLIFHWIRGHAGHPENERCDLLARQAASRSNLPPDPGYTP
jgi:ribonuclease HI